MCCNALQTGGLWDTQAVSTCPGGTTTGRKLLAGRQLTATVLLPTTAAALGNTIASSDFEVLPNPVFSGRYNSSTAARATFDLHYSKSGYYYSGSYAARATVSAAGSQPWDIQITSVNINLEAGKSYQVRRDVDGASPPLDDS